MDKRVLIATILSLTILLFYPYYLKFLGITPSKPRYSPKIPSNDTVKSTDDTVIKNDTVVSLQEKGNDMVSDTVLENQLFKLGLNFKTGSILGILYKGEEGIIELYPLCNKKLGLFVPTVSTVSFSPSFKNNAEIVLNSKEFTREYRLRENLLILTLKGEKNFYFYFPSKFDLPYRDRRYLRLIFKNTQGASVSLPPSKLMPKPGNFKNIDWFGLSFRYYSLIVDPDVPVEIKSIPQKANSVLLLKWNGNSDEIEIKNYIGPNSKPILVKYNKNWLSLLDYGILSNFIKSLLAGFSKLTGGYGLAIIFLAFLFNLMFVPLTLKSFRSMKRMQGLQPQIQALREKYKEDPQTLNKEMLLLYRKYGVNPMSGCLPMLFQLPIFIALYNTLMRSYELKTASFLWIKDLSQPDRLFIFSQKLPLIGNEINLLPLLMAFLMYLQQKTSPASKASSPNLWFLPIIFGIIFYKFPAGLVLYWLTNSIFMLGLQWLRK